MDSNIFETFGHGSIDLLFVWIQEQTFYLISTLFSHVATSALNGGDIVDIYTTFQFVGNVCLHLLEILQINVQIEAHIHNNIVSNCQD